MSTVADLVTMARRHVRPFVREKAAVMGAGATTGETVWNIGTTMTPIEEGDFLSVGYEEVLVVGSSGTSVTVVRAQNGTTAGTVTNGALVEVNPRFPRGVIAQFIRDDVRSWPASLFRTETQVVTFDAGDNTAELIPSDNTTVYKVLASHRLADPDSGGTTRWKRPKIALLRGFDPGVYAYDMALQVHADAGYSFAEAVEVHVTLATAFDLSEWEPTTDLDDVGLTDTMYDIAPLGAAARMLESYEAERADPIASGQSRYAEAVPPKANATAADMFERRHQRRIGEEVKRLRDLWGVGF